MLSHSIPGLLDEADSDPLLVVFGIHSQIRQISHIFKIGEGSGDADESFAIPGRDDEVGMAEHCIHCISVVDRSSFAQGRSFVQIYNDIEVEIVSKSI